MIEAMAASGDRALFAISTISHCWKKSGFRSTRSKTLSASARASVRFARSLNKPN